MRASWAPSMQAVGARQPPYNLPSMLSCLHRQAGSRPCCSRAAAGPASQTLPQRPHWRCCSDAAACMQAAAALLRWDQPMAQPMHAALKVLPRRATAMTQS